MLLYEAYQQVGISIASLAYYCGPVIVMILSPFLFRETLTWPKIAGFLTVLAGMCLVNLQALDEGKTIWGLFCGLMSAFMYALMVTANKKAKAEIATLQESNKHEIEKLMKQHEVDIESLKEKHQLETEKCEQEHKHKIEIMQIEHKNALESNEKQQSNAAMFSVMTDIIKEPQKLQGLLELANNPAFKNK